MCTVIVEVPTEAADPIRLLAVRDEDPERPWDPPAPWWPETAPGIVGVRDRRANGAWLAADLTERRLAVILNRPEQLAPRLAPGEPPLGSRGELPLRAAAGEALPAPPRTESFNLVTVSDGTVSVRQWDGDELRAVRLAPGVHMLAHHEVDDPSTPRIARWLPEFRRLAGLPAGIWKQRWIETLGRSAELPADDDRAIIRDNRAHGFPTQSLLACLAELPRTGAATLDFAGLDEPAHWHHEAFRAAAH